MCDLLTNNVVHAGVNVLNLSGVVAPPFRCLLRVVVRLAGCGALEFSFGCLGINAAGEDVASFGGHLLNAYNY